MRRTATGPGIGVALNAYVAPLRAVNVGGTGNLAMNDLKAPCERAGFLGVWAYIASRNNIFASRMSEAEVEAALESALEDHAGRPVGVPVRTAAEMDAAAVGPVPRLAGGPDRVAPPAAVP